MPEAQLLQQARSQVQLGNEGEGVHGGINEAFEVGRALVRTGYADPAKFRCKGFAATRRRQDRNFVSEISKLTGNCGAHAGSGGGKKCDFRSDCLFLSLVGIAPCCRWHVGAPTTDPKGIKELFVLPKCRPEGIVGLGIQPFLGFLCLIIDRKDGEALRALVP